MADRKVPLILNALADDSTSSHEEALLRIYQRLRPGNPPQLEKAKLLFQEKFYDINRYRLGRVGRFRINRKLGLNVLGQGDDAAARRYDRCHQLPDRTGHGGAQRRGGRHRPPGEPPPADDRRVGV